MEVVDSAKISDENSSMSSNQIAGGFEIARFSSNSADIADSSLRVARLPVIA
jgi:hypothetical protein